MSWFPPQTGAPLPVVVVNGATPSTGPGWWPPTMANPLPVEVITTGADPGTQGWRPPSRANPLPVRQVGAAPAGVTGWFPADPALGAAIPVEIIVGATPSVGPGWWPPSRANPLPVVMV
ncbi:MAG TPA: hypothetical protein VGF07_01995 [Stellaceae bacterium]